MKNIDKFTFEKTKTKDSANKKEYAKKLYDNSVPIKGTLAERYLKDYRKLPEYQNAELRFLPNITTWHGDKKAQVPALLCVAKDSHGEFNHLQAIRLNPITGDKDSASRVVKQTYGALNGCPIELNKTSTSNTTYITEGVETGLSILAGDPNAKVLAMVGKNNFNKVDLTRLTDSVVLCLDNDGDVTFKDSVIEKAVLRLTEAGKFVSLILPKKMGDDLNDILKRDGASVIKQIIERKIDAKLVFSHSAEKQTELNGSQETRSLINKILAIENNQISNCKSIDNMSTINLRNISISQKNNDALMSNKLNSTIELNKIQNHKIIEKEMG